MKSRSKRHRTKPAVLPTKISKPHRSPIPLQKMIFSGEASTDTMRTHRKVNVENALSLPQSSGSSVILVREIFSFLLAENRKRTLGEPPVGVRTTPAVPPPEMLLPPVRSNVKMAKPKSQRCILPHSKK